MTWIGSFGSVGSGSVGSGSVGSGSVGSVSVGSVGSGLSSAAFRKRHRSVAASARVRGFCGRKLPSG